MIRSDRQAPPPQKTGPVTGINFIGMMNHKGGIGNAARMNYDQVANLGLPCAWSDSYQDPRTIADPPYNLNIFHFNPESVNLHALLECKWFGFRNILYAAWETTQIPDEWLKWDQWIDILWVPSEFTKMAFVSGGWKGRIDVVPHFVTHIHRRVTSAHEPDLKNLRMLVPFDAKSRIERKLPHLSIAATVLACLEADISHEIVIKTHDCPNSILGEVIGRAEQIIKRHAPSWDKKMTLGLYSEWMTETELSILMSSCHAVISLNRGEGFGLSGIEAMSMGVPIVWTNWGGSTQYMTPSNCYPVEPAAIVEVMDTDYFKTGSWAEPSLVSAVDQIKNLIADIDSGRIDNVIVSACETADRFTPDPVREIMRASIERIL
jgi:glycosyltransferase involved in cell wall biosynthesis